MLKEIVQKSAPIHTRQITLSTHRSKKNGLIVHGELKDERHLPIIDILGQPKEPGIVHHMTVTLAVGQDPLRIIGAEAEMITVPTPYCPDTLDRIPGLIDLEIKSGFSSAVKRIVGKSQGCVHLCTLVTALGTEILHGWLTEKRASKSKDLKRLDPRVLLKDTCRVWKKGGPRMTALDQAMAEKRF